MKSRGNVEFVAVPESDPAHILSSETGLVADRPIDDAKLLFLFEPEGRESDDRGGILGTD